ncbi:hypothetical protein ACRALDRAFT_1075443 [Sodiomyces alcalophilus JCM 7366]|uniref:uncharacterized protein n=1 Tax=Sodiomyces alcalophilus JCM 7366 TaxID=591952 RepID=UPI0039B6BED1
MPPLKPPRVSYVEDTNEDTGSVIAGTERYAVSEAPSPVKQRLHSGKLRRDRSRSRSGSSSPHNGLIDSDSTAHPISLSRREREAKMRAREEREWERDRESHRDDERAERARERERERPRSSKKSSARPTTRPSKTNPALHSHTHSQDHYGRSTSIGDESSFYGVSPSSAARPRAMTTRPPSYYGAGSRPPPSTMQWYPHHPPPPHHLPHHHPPPYHPPPHQAPHHQPPNPYIPTSYPPASYGPSPGSHYPVPQSPTHTADYFGPSAVNGPQHQHLAQRFQRPSSAMGVRTISSSYGFDDYDQGYDASLTRRPSSSKKKHRDEEDRRRMPPPPRPVTAAPRQSAIRGPPSHPPPQPAQPRGSIGFGFDDGGFDDGDFDGDESLYREIPARSASYSYAYGEGAILPRARRDSVSYEGSAYRIEPATSSGRRHSYYGGSGGSADSLDYEDKFRAATAYQDDVAGSYTLPLTAETLRKAGKRSSDKSSRSTRSSESRDESDYRQSHTTRTTRSSAGDEDITIRVTGSATLKLGGAEIQCQDGGEISITQPVSGRPGGISDKDGSVYSDDRRSQPHDDDWNESNEV